MASQSLKVLLVLIIVVLAKKTTSQNLTTQAAQTTIKPASVTTPTAKNTTTHVVTTHRNPTSESLTTTMTPEEVCESKNASCSDCINAEGAKCLWCGSKNKCTLYPASKILPPKEICALDDARWGVCWLNFEALIISLSVIGGLLLISTGCCVYCCCCRGGSNKKLDRDEARFNTQKMERKARNDERKAERKEKLDEIRRKYGLMKDEPYQRFDA